MREGGARTPVVFLTARDGHRQDPRPHPRRRRLRHQAVQPGGAHRPDPGRAAPHHGRRRAPSRLAFADLELDEETHEVYRAGAAGAALADRVQAAALPDAQRQPGALQGADPRPRLEVRLPRRRHIVESYISYLRRKVDNVPAATDPHPARRRIRPAGPAAVTRMRAVLASAPLRVRVLAVAAILVTVTSVVTGWLGTALLSVTCSAAATHSCAASRRWPATSWPTPGRRAARPRARARACPPSSRAGGQRRWAQPGGRGFRARGPPAAAVSRAAARLVRPVHRGRRGRGRR